MLKQPETDREENIEYCCKGTTGVKKESMSVK